MSKSTIKVSREELARIINQFKESGSSHLFSVQFIKKDNSIRKLVGRFHVQKGVKGVGLKYNPTNYGLINVFDINNDGFRMVNTETLMSASIDGFKFEVL